MKRGVLNKFFCFPPYQFSIPKNVCLARLLRLETWNFAWGLVLPIHMLYKKLSMIRDKKCNLEHSNVHHTKFWSIMDELCSTIQHTWHHKSSCASCYILVNHGWTMLNNTTYMTSQVIICIIPYFGQSLMNFTQQQYIHDITCNHTLIWSILD